MKIMKTHKFNKYLTAFYCLIIIVLSSCEDFLKEDARNFINPNSFYTNQSDAESGVAGIYQRIATGYGLAHGIPFINFVNSDNSWPWSLTAYDVGFNFTPDVQWCGDIWNMCYDGIKRANSFIDVMEKTQISFPQTIKDRMIGEAKFLRAFYYYNLVQFYGDVPLVNKTYDSSDDFFIDRSPSSEVWEFVIKDLQDATGLLPSKSSYTGKDVSRANKEAAKMILAKIYMIKLDWQNAKKYVEEIINSGEYSLETDILDNWRTANEHGKESIFEIDYGSGFSPSLGNSLFNLSGPSGLKHPLTGQTIGGLWTGVAFSPAF